MDILGSLRHSENPEDKYLACLGRNPLGWDKRLAVHEDVPEAARTTPNTTHPKPPKPPDIPHAPYIPQTLTRNSKAPSSSSGAGISQVESFRGLGLSEQPYGFRVS